MSDEEAPPEAELYCDSCARGISIKDVSNSLRCPHCGAALFINPKLVRRDRVSQPWSKGRKLRLLGTRLQGRRRHD